MTETNTAIPTNIITGFLGVGKTTALQHILTLKPEGETWAILVNEFGEVGLDASLIQTAPKQKQNIAIREVPGGCMCCTSGLPMQVALNQLIKLSKPARIFIEPTGLGHPKAILKSLSHSSYQGVLDIQNTLTLVDARKITDTRYTEHETFRQQLQIADIIIANKSDQFDLSAVNNLKHYLSTMQLSHLPLYEVTQGQIELAWLDRKQTNTGSTVCIKSKPVNSLQTDDTNAHIADLAQGNMKLPSCGYIRKENSGSGYRSSGWVFCKRFIFDENQLISIFSGLDVTRLKALFITNKGVMSFNQVDTVLNYSHITTDIEAMDSRIEVIGQNPTAWEGLEEQLLIASTVKN